MKYYGSLDNRIAESQKAVKPEVGMGATLIMYSDRKPYTILEVSEETVTSLNNEKYPKYIIVTQDFCKRISGSVYDGDAEYEYTTDYNGPRTKFLFHKPSSTYKEETKKFAGINKETGLLYYEGTGRTKADASTLLIGVKENYYDATF